MTTEDSTENMPEIFYIRDDSNGGYEFTDDGDPIGFSYYSQAELDRRVAEAGERQRIDIRDKIFKGISGCGDNSCLIKKPKGMATNGGCRCKENRAKMNIILSRLSAILNAGGKGDE